MTTPVKAKIRRPRRLTGRRRRNGFTAGRSEPGAQRSAKA
jgi:hypothetical protein